MTCQYDDGFAAFINGYPVASANAPATPVHNSTATAQHPDAEAAVFESFPFALPVGVLRKGRNVLAIHGLNYSANSTNSSDFYLLPELDAVSSLGPPVFAWFREPTPGAVNSTPSVAGFVADTTFSVKRGWKTQPFTLEMATARARTTWRQRIPTATTRRTGKTTCGGSRSASSDGSPALEA
jgi:hypothetical protein